jgi:ATP-dependent Clp protease ATP-binding subunit ClpA
MGHNYVGTEHMLLALIRNDTEPAHRILTSLGVTMDAVEPWLIGAINARLAERGLDPVTIAARPRRRRTPRRH